MQLNWSHEGLKMLKEIKSIPFLNFLVTKLSLSLKMQVVQTLPMFDKFSDFPNVLTEFN